MNITRLFLIIAPILAGLAVAAGAFASHALKERLSANALTIWETGAKYQIYHALALLLVAILMIYSDNNQNWLISSGISFMIGILLFSGSLYALSLSGVKWLGAITPLGGVAFLIGWACLVIYGWFRTY